MNFDDLPEKLSHGDASLVEHWHDQLWQVEPDVGDVDGHVFSQLQDFLQPDQRENTETEWTCFQIHKAASGIKTSTTHANYASVAPYWPFVIFGRWQGASLDQLLQQLAQVLPGDGAALQCRLQSSSHKHKQQRCAVQLLHTLKSLLLGHRGTEFVVRGQRS